MEIQQQKYDVIVVGGGAYGLAICYHLSQYTQLSICLLEQYIIGHTHGSSHAQTRIIRSIYEHELFSELASISRKQSWPKMQQILQCKLVQDSSHLHFDENQQTYHKYEKVAKKSKSLSFLSNQELVQMYPQLKNIKHKYPPIIDQNSGIILSSKYIQTVSQYLRNKQNVTIMQHTVVNKIIENNYQIDLETDVQVIRGRKVVLACGQWIAKLVPEMGTLVKTIKQQVGYFKMQPYHQFTVSNCPTFSHRNEKMTKYYFVPIVKENEIKLGIHDVGTYNKDNQLQSAITATTNELFKQAVIYFGESLEQPIRYEDCYYTCTKNQGFIIDWIDINMKILVCSACSGHGFKFAPIIGQIISELLQSDTSSIELFNKYRHQFRMAYHQGINLQ